MCDMEQIVAVNNSLDARTFAAGLEQLDRVSASQKNVTVAADAWFVCAVTFWLCQANILHARGLVAGLTRRLRSVSKRRTVWRLLQLFGLACLVIVVLTHVAETFHLFPTMGWGQPNSTGHYVDLVSAILGCTLLPLGLVGDALLRSQKRTPSE
jgi:hypothetical protein